MADGVYKEACGIVLLSFGAEDQGKEGMLLAS